MHFFAGLDWGSTEHSLCIIDEQGRVAKQLRAPHTAEGLKRLTHALSHIAPASHISVAIERPTGLLVDTLVEAGHDVVPIHPNTVKACRSRYSAAGGKSDRGDAYILADVLRTDGHRFRVLRPHSDALRALRAQVRVRDDLVRHRVALANQLTALLESFWPGAASIFAAVDSPIALAFLERYPTPAATRGLGEKRLAAFLARNSYSGRRSPAELLERLDSAPTPICSEAEAEAKGHLVVAYVTSLKPIAAEIKNLSSAIELRVAEMPAGRIIMSFPRAGKINAAQILSELGEDPHRFTSSRQMAAEAGVAPVTYESGKHRHVACRSACNKRLRNAVTTWADNSRRASPWAQDIYARARARGCRHPHAVRILARAWLRVLWRCWIDSTPYQPDHHKGAMALPTPATSPGG